MELSLRHQIAALALTIGGLFLIITYTAPLPEQSSTATTTSAAAAATSQAATTSVATTTATSKATSTPKKAVVAVVEKPKAEATKPASVKPANPNEIHRIQNPYPTAPLRFETVNSMSRPALVNIFCGSNNGLLRPISGSAVIIDPKGIILTNAHVAQYVMLAESGRVNMYCQIRTGSPATPKWRPHVLFLPPVWIEEHAADLTKEHPVGTGKHDYALLYIGEPLDGSPRPASFPAVSVDTRDAIGFVDDPILAGSYPAEFLGSIANTQNLFPVTSTTHISQLFTLGTGTVDVISIGGVISAQSGSSGGGIINAWGRLIGLITTTSEGATTAERDLRGITLSYIDRDIKAESGSSLATLLAGNPAALATEFTAKTAPALVSELLKQLR